MFGVLYSCCNFFLFVGWIEGSLKGVGCVLNIVVKYKKGLIFKEDKW